MVHPQWGSRGPTRTVAALRWQGDTIQAPALNNLALCRSYPQRLPESVPHELHCGTTASNAQLNLRVKACGGPGGSPPYFEVPSLITSSYTSPHTSVRTCK